MALPCWLSETASLLAGDLVDTSERDASELESERTADRLGVVRVCPERILSMPAIVKPFLQKWEPVQSLSTMGSNTLAIFSSIVEKGQNTVAVIFGVKSGEQNG